MKEPDPAPPDAQPIAEPLLFWQSLWPTPDAVPTVSRYSAEIMEELVESVAVMLSGSSLICIDENDVRHVLSQPGRACVGIGEAAGEMRVKEAVDRASADFLTDQDGLAQVSGLVIMIAGSTRLGLKEISAVMNKVRERFEDAEFVFGQVFDDDLGETLRVYLVGVCGSQVGEA
jgi:cell division protein FtsZ